MYAAQCEHCIRQIDQILKVTTLSKVLKAEMELFWRLRGTFQILAQVDWCRPLSLPDVLWDRLLQAPNLQLNFNAANLYWMTFLSGPQRPTQRAITQWNLLPLGDVLCDLIQRLPKKRSCKATLSISSDQLMHIDYTSEHFWETSVFYPICQSLVAYRELSICVLIHDLAPLVREDGSEWLGNHQEECSESGHRYLQKALCGAGKFLK